MEVFFFEGGGGGGGESIRRRSQKRKKGKSGGRVKKKGEREKGRDKMGRKGGEEKKRKGRDKWEEKRKKETKGRDLHWRDTNEKVKEALSRRPAGKSDPHGRRQGCIPLSISSVFPLFIFSILLVLFVSQTNRELYLNGFSIVLS